MKKVVSIQNIDCAACAMKLERAIAKVEGVNQASINFISQKLILDINDAEYPAAVERIKAVAAKVEPEARFKL